MASSKISLIILISAFGCFVHCEHLNIWGDLTTQIILGSNSAKVGIPFLTRTFEISYPDEFDEPEQNIVKGIKHASYLSDSACHPKAEIIKGGINQKFATVKVTSKRGCGLNSLVEFFLERK